MGVHAMEQEDQPTGYLAGVRAGAPFAVATMALGISFGVVAQAAGWGIVAPLVFSIVAFSGAAQFAALATLAGGGSIAAAVIAAALLNMRYVPMGIGVAPWLRGGRLRKALEAQSMVDASWVIAHRGEGRFDREMMMGATLPQALSWMCGTAIGGFIGGGDFVEAYGLDVIFPAFFAALLVSELRSGRRVSVIVAGFAALIALATMPVFPAGIPIVAAGLAALAGLRSTAR